MLPYKDNVYWFCWWVMSIGLIIICLCGVCKADEPGLWRISHYCACQKCCGKSDGIMASGKKVYPGAIACNWLPFGTKVVINDKTYIVEDRGAKSIFGSKNNHKKAIDIYCNSHKEALRKGVYYAEVRY